MTYSGSEGANSAAETVALTKDGSVVVGGFIDSPMSFEQLYFKSEGQVTDGTNFIAKLTSQ